MSNQRYSPEFKDDAVALVREQGYTVPEAAKHPCSKRGGRGW